MIESDFDPAFSRHLLSFGDALRDRGLSIGTDDLVVASQALLVADTLDRDEVYYSLKAALVTDPSDVEPFDETFESWWDGAVGTDDPDEEPVELDQSGPATPPPDELEQSGEEREPSAETDPPRDTRKRDVDDPESIESDPADTRRERTDAAHDQRAFDAERVGETLGQQRGTERLSVSDRTPAPHEELELLVRELGVQLGTLEGFDDRRGPAGRPDLRSALNQARLQDPTALPRLERRRTETKLRLFVDVSQSMLRNVDPVFLIQFCYECVRQYPDCRVYFFDTAITDVTGHFEAAALEETVDAMRRAQTEWGAGTTIGRCLEAVLATDPFTVDGDTVVTIISDGWDAGDLDQLASQLAALSRRGERLLWLNPLATSPDYRPSVGGMATALPYVDNFYGFEGVADLRDVVADLRGRVDNR